MMERLINCDASEPSDEQKRTKSPRQSTTHSPDGLDVNVTDPRLHIHRPDGGCIAHVTFYIRVSARSDEGFVCEPAKPPRLRKKGTAKSVLAHAMLEVFGVEHAPTVNRKPSECQGRLSSALTRRDESFFSFFAILARRKRLSRKNAPLSRIRQRSPDNFLVDVTIKFNYAIKLHLIAKCVACGAGFCDGD